MKPFTLLIKTTRIILMAFALITATACSAEPASDIVEWAIGQKHPSIEMGTVKIKSYDITNHYTRQVRDETIYLYDYTAKTTSKLYTGEQAIKGSFAVVKRGEKWYIY